MKRTGKPKASVDRGRKRRPDSARTEQRRERRPRERNDLQVLAAALRWNTAHVRRLEIGAEQRRYQTAQKRGLASVVHPLG